MSNNKSLSYGLNFSAKKPPSRTNASATAPPERNLSSLLSASKHSAAAQDLDPSIYDYDGAYDAISSAKAAAATSKTSGSTGPKYMARLLEAAETRKRDQLAAKEKMLAKEREKEGDAFADKEKFVTGAYKKQQEEVRLAEEDERRKEALEAERRRKGGGGMRALYQGLLEREEKMHGAAVLAVEAGKKGGGKGNVFGEDEEEEDGDEQQKEADLAKKSGAAVNEDGQVVDKRDLLRAGLNIKAKPKSTSNNRSGSDADRRDSPLNGSSGAGRGLSNSKQAMRERQSRMLEEQLASAAKRVADQELAELEAVQRAAKSRKTEGEISSAKERYLQRKREAEAAKLAGVDGDGD